MARDLISRILGRVDYSPASNGTKAAEPPAQKADGAAPTDVKAESIAFFSPTSDLRQIVRIGPLATSETDEVTRHTAFSAAIYAYAAMTWRAEKYSEPPIFVGELTDDDEFEWMPDHDLAALLDHPHPDLDMGELFYQTRLYRDATGAALWVKDLDRAGRIGRLTPFSADEFTVERADGRMFGQFHVQTANGSKTLPAERCVYFREPGPSPWGRGVAPLDVALQTLNMGKQATATVKSILKNALFPSVVVQAHPEWNPSEIEFERWKAMLDAYGETEHKGKPLGLTGGGSASVVSMSLKDLIPSEILDRVESNVSAAFRVPPIVLQFKVGLENSPWSQMEEARRSVTQDLLVPMWTRDGKKMTAQLLRAPTEPGRAELDTDPHHHIRFALTEVAALQPDRIQQTEQAKNSTEFARIRDLRQIAGLEPLEDSDPRNEIIPGLQGPGPSETLEETRTASARPDIATKADDGTRAIQWYDFELFTKAEAPGWIGPVLEALNGQREEIEALAADLLTETDGVIDARDVQAFIEAADEYLDTEGKALLRERLGPLIEQTATRAVRRVSARLGIDFGLLQPGILTYTESEAALLVTGATDTSKEAIRSALNQSLEAGESIGKMTRRIQDIGFDRDRARLIARTETTRVSNGAQRRSMQDWSATTSQTVEKTWLSSRDSRVRASHLAVDGDTVPIDQPFSNGLMEPSEPNCRCTLLYDVTEDD